MRQQTDSTQVTKISIKNNEREKIVFVCVRVIDVMSYCLLRHIWEAQRPSTDFLWPFTTETGKTWWPHMTKLLLAHLAPCPHTRTAVIIMMCVLTVKKIIIIDYIRTQCMAYSHTNTLPLGFDLPRTVPSMRVGRPNS
jgi:hypothetical protein